MVMLAWQNTDNIYYSLKCIVGNSQKQLRVHTVILQSLPEIGDIFETKEWEPYFFLYNE